MSRLITPSLVSSVSFLRSCPSTWKAKAALDLSNQLARIYGTPDAACQLGIKFEDTVYSNADKPCTPGSDHFNWFVEECKGGQFQRKSVSYLTIDGVEYCLYGKLDAWWPNRIKDIKTTSNYKGPSHYLSTFQHKMYCYNESISDFDYLVAVFNEQQQIVDHHKISYCMPERSQVELELVTTIKEVVKFLSSNKQLFDLYCNTFSTKNT